MFQSLEEILQTCSREKKLFWEVVLEDDCKEEGITREESLEKMNQTWKAMADSDRAYDPGLLSASGLSGGDAAKMDAWRKKGTTICGDFLNRMMVRALRVAESNACMKRIVAAPTAGACGVIPAVLLTIQEEKKLEDSSMVRALYVARGIGSVIAGRFCISGAEGGCQAEIGSAAAMASGAAVYLMGGTNEEIANACALTISSMLGLVCDPVAGLVEVPCVKRNVTGTMNAVAAAEMTLAGIQTRIPPDEVIDAMKSVGRSIVPELRETGLGGLAATQTGQKIREALESEQ